MTTAKITMAKPSSDEMEKMLAFFEGLQSIMEGNYEDVGNSDPYPDEQSILYDYIQKQYQEFLSYSWQRFYFAFSVLLNNAADPDKTYLAWKPEIERILNEAGYGATKNEQH